MKKTQWISLFATIRKNLISFIAIILFISLSIGIYAGMGWVSSAIEESTNSIFNGKDVRSYELLLPYGVSDEDLKALEAVDGVDAVEGANVAYGSFLHDGIRLQAAVYQIPNKIDSLVSVDGNLPSKVGEIAVESSWAEANKVKVGDTFKFEKNDDGSSRLVNSLLSIKETDSTTDLQNASDLYKKSDSGMAQLNTDTFKVTAIVKPSSILFSAKTAMGFSSSTKKMNDCVMFVSPKSLDDRAYNGYTRVLVHTADANKDFLFDEQYSANLKATQENVEKTAKQLTTKRYKLISDKANSICTMMRNKLDEARTTLDDSKVQLDSAKNQIAEGENELAKAKSTIESGEKNLKAKEAELNAGKAKVNAAENEIRSRIESSMQENVNYLSDELSALDKYDLPEGYQLPEDFINHVRTQSVEETYKELQQIYDIATENIDQLKDSDLDESEIAIINAVLAQYRTQLDELGGAVQQITVAKSKIRDGESQLASARKELENGKQKYRDGLATLNSSKAQYEDGLARYNDGLKQYEEGEIKYTELKSLTRNISDYGYAITNTVENQSYIIAKGITNVVRKTRQSLAALFIIVALMVSFAVIARLVNEEIRLIGTRKALGMKAKEIMMEYLLFSGCALIISLILGFLIAYYAIEPVLLSSMATAYTGGNLHSIIVAKDFLIIAAINIVFMLLVTWSAVNKVIKRNTISLLNEEVIKKTKSRFYEKWPVYQKMSLLSQVIVNNCFNDKRRVAATIVGVAGCASLIVTAFAYSDIASDDMNIQFDKYMHFNYVVEFDSSEVNAEKNIKEALNKENIDNALVYSDMSIMTTPKGESVPMYIRVAIDDKYNGLITPVTDYGDEKDAYKGLWISHSVKKNEGLSDDDSLSIMPLDGSRKEIKPSGYMYSYLMVVNMFADQKSYEDAFNTSVKGNSFIISSDKSINELNDLLFNIPGYRSIEDYYSVQDESFEQINSITSIMKVMFTVLSVVLAILVLLNLFTMFVLEKKKELIVMIINGYTYRDARRYVYSDTIVLTIIGIIVGVLLGELVANLAVGSFESIATIFHSRFDWAAAGIGALVTAVLTFVMSTISLRKVSKLDLTELSK